VEEAIGYIGEGKPLGWCLTKACWRCPRAITGTVAMAIPIPFQLRATPMKWRLCVIVLIGGLGPIDLHAAEASDQAPDLNDQVPLPDLNRPADLRNQPMKLAAGSPQA